MMCWWVDAGCVGKGKALVDTIMHAEDESGVLHVGLSCMADLGGR